jgi:hypothetical protein
MTGVVSNVPFWGPVMVPPKLKPTAPTLQVLTPVQKSLEGLKKSWLVRS